MNFSCCVFFFVLFFSGEIVSCATRSSPSIYSIDAVSNNNRSDRIRLQIGVSAADVGGMAGEQRVLRLVLTKVLTVAVDRMMVICKIRVRNHLPPKPNPITDLPTVAGSLCLEATGADVVVHRGGGGQQEQHNEHRDDHRHHRRRPGVWLFRAGAVDRQGAGWRKVTTSRECCVCARVRVRDCDGTRRR